ncbi:MAG: bifunctional folylpolyglutamate synthase/dihydrofolate synthase [Chitinophagales bacterium]|nr:bifunctional folylpolyglutamate synthase/dihydrofolate synthase [Chitinophagales bacterium]
MNYEEAVQFLYQQLPMFSRIGAAAYKKDLTNTLLLCDLLGNPENKFKSIHIAGTNGKGSVSHMLAAILQQSGYKTGLYTSPHLKDFRERIRINGIMIPEGTVIDFVEQYRNDVIKIGCSFFEWSVGLAFKYFAEEKVDIAVIETGLGGRLDSTNVIFPLVSVITNISYDHMDLLGDTIEKIAVEKAGIIKKNIPVVIGESQTDKIGPEKELEKEISGNIIQSVESTSEKNKIKSAAGVFLDTAIERNAAIFFADQNYAITHAEFIRTSSNNEKLKLNLIKKYDDSFSKIFELDLTGYYQEKNVVTVLQTVELLQQIDFTISDDDLYQGLANVKKLTGLRGRWDILSEHPLIIADVAHNEAGLQYAMQQLKTYPVKNLHLVLGFVKEKALSKILVLFPKEAHYYFCCPDIPRGLDAESLRQAANESGLQGDSYPSVSVAFEAAKKNAVEEDLIYAGGSTYVVAEVI